jgi:hypothetical protein
MRLHLLSEGIVASELGDVTKLKNSLANQLMIALERLGFRKPNMKPAENPTDDAIVYIEAGQNALTRESQTIVVTIEDDDSVRIQIPSDISRSGKKNLAEILGIDDFFITGSVGEAIARLKAIKRKADHLIQKSGLRGSLSSGHIGESEEPPAVDYTVGEFQVNSTKNGRFLSSQLERFLNAKMPNLIVLRQSVWEPRAQTGWLSCATVIYMCRGTTSLKQQLKELFAQEDYFDFIPTRYKTIGIASTVEEFLGLYGHYELSPTWTNIINNMADKFEAGMVD